MKIQRKISQLKMLKLKIFIKEINWMFNKYKWLKNNKNSGKIKKKVLTCKYRPQHEILII